MSQTTRLPSLSHLGLPGARDGLDRYNIVSTDDVKEAIEKMSVPRIP